MWRSLLSSSPLYRWEWERLRAHILVKVMLWLITVPGFEPGSVRAVHWVHKGPPWFFPVFLKAPDWSIFWSCQTLALDCCHLSLSLALVIPSCFRVMGDGVIECPMGHCGRTANEHLPHPGAPGVSGRWYLGWGKRRRFKSWRQTSQRNFQLCFDEQKLQGGKRSRRCDLAEDQGQVIKGTSCGKPRAVKLIVCASATL